MTIPFPGGQGKLSLKPLFKYTGGKTKMIPYYIPHMPTKISTYVEPFLGGASMFLYVMANYRPNKIVLGDFNTELINLYQQIQNGFDSFRNELKEIEKLYSVCYDVPTRQDQYRIFREEYARDETITKSREAALLYFMLQTCFNGQYAVTTNGRFYTSPGEMLVSHPIRWNQLEGWNVLLKDVTINQGDWRDTLKLTEPFPEDSFVFLDPPYRESNLHKMYMQGMHEDTQQDRVLSYVRDFGKEATIFYCNMERDETGYFDWLENCGYEICRFERSVKTAQNSEHAHPITEILIHNNFENRLPF